MTTPFKGTMTGSTSCRRPLTQAERFGERMPVRPTIARELSGIARAEHRWQLYPA
jgi:hypothetical protein